MKLELWISYFLRAGIIVSGALIGIGFVLMLVQGGVTLEAYKTYEAQSFVDMLQWSYLLNQSGVLLVAFGLAVLVTLPLARVFLTGILLYLSKEWIMGSVSMFVFITLIVSFALGLK